MDVTRLRLQKISRIASVVALTLSVAACLQPVNTMRIGNNTNAQSLSEVSVGKIDGYLGYILKSELDFLLSENGKISGKRYILSVKTQEAQEGTIVDSTTGRVQVASLLVQAIYEIRDTQSGKIIASGKTFSTASYDRSPQRFSADRAKRDAQEKVARSLAERLRAIIILALKDVPNTKVNEAPAFNRPIFDETPNSSEPGNDE